LTTLGILDCVRSRHSSTAQRYRPDRAGERAQDAQARLLSKLKNGGSGAWGQVPMPAQSQLSESNARAVVEWILAGAK
jgi:S-disulfanyl-L-cysteine oxidoreductase SoxD